MYMYPFSFDEFLEAQGLGLQTDYKQNEADCEHPLPAPLHQEMISQLRSYYLVGGMPEAVRIWVETTDYNVTPVTHTAANDIPLGAEINEKFRKFLFLDVGLMQSSLGIQPMDILITNETDFVNKGRMSEIFARLELMKYASYLKKADLYYWQRTERNAQAE